MFLSSGSSPDFDGSESVLAEPGLDPASHVHGANGFSSRAAFDQAMLWSLKPAALVSAGLHAFLGVYYWSVYEVQIRFPLTMAALIGLVVSGLTYGLVSRVRFKPEQAHPVGSLLVLAAIGSFVCHVLVKQQPVLAFNASILVMALGCFYLSWVYLSVSAGVVLAVLMWAALRLNPAANWTEFVGPTVAAVFVSVLVHEVRRQLVTRTAALTAGLRKRERELAFRTDFERLLREISQSFISQGSDDIDLAARAAMRKVREFVDVDHVYVARLENSPPTIRVTHFNSRPGLRFEDWKIDGCEIQTFPWFWRHIESGRVCSIPCVTDLPDEAVRSREFLESKDVKSFLAVPLHSLGVPWGYLGLVVYERETDWTTDTIALLQSLGEILYLALARKTAEERAASLRSQLQHISRLTVVGETAAFVNHEVKNSFQTILTTIGAAQNLLPEDEATARTLHSALHLLQRVVDSTMEVLQRQKIMARSEVAAPEPFSLHEAARDACEFSSMRFEDGDVALVNDVDPDFPLVMGTKSSITQVLTNLLYNAHDAIKQSDVRPAEPCVRLHSVQDQPGFIKLLVADNGPGIPRGAEESIFGQFVTTKAEGLGVGLSISRDVVEQLGGELTARNLPEAGCEFCIRLPIHAG